MAGLFVEVEPTEWAEDTPGTFVVDHEGHHRRYRPVGDVIELTEQRREVAGQDVGGALNAKDYTEYRLTSEWMTR